MTEFTPVSALIGGALIGLAATLLMLFNGRIAGVSGVVGGVAQRLGGGAKASPDFAWQGLFVLGLVGGAALHRALAVTPPPVQISQSVLLLIAGGLLVGIGTRMGHGCTSGHGVCGMARLSSRSIAATLVYLAVAIVTVFVTRHLIAI